MIAGRRAAGPRYLSLLAVLLTWIPAGAPAQEATGGDGRLRGLVFDSTMMKPLSGARVVVLGTAVTGWSDEDGRFRLEGIPAGERFVSFFHPRLQALGVSPTSRQVAFSDGRTADVTLAVPSETTLLGAWCSAESQGSGFAPLAGTVRDTLTGVPLPRATVTVRRMDAATGRRVGEPIEERTDDAGYYRFCNVPAGPVVAQAHFGRNSGIGVRLDLREGEPVLQDLGLVLSTVGQLQGRVTEYATGKPISGASVTLLGTDLRQLTDEDGRFVLDSISPGRQVVQTEFLGHAPRIDSVTVFSDEAVRVEVKLTTEPIAIEGMVVTARGRLGEALVDVGRRMDYIGRAEIEPMLPRLRDMQDLLRQANFPSLSIREVGLQDPLREGSVTPGLCVEAIRLQRTDGCQMVLIMVDGVRLPAPEETLTALLPENIESVQYLSPMEATTRFGTAGGAGVLLITTRAGR